MKHAKIRLFSLKWDSELLYFSTRGWFLQLSFDILLMFLGHTNPKLCLSVTAIVVNSSKITKLRKKQLKVKILQNISELKCQFA